MIIAFDSEKEGYPKLIQSWVEVGASKTNKCCQIICQDAVIRFKPKQGFFKNFDTKDSSPSIRGVDKRRCNSNGRVFVSPLAKKLAEEKCYLLMAV